MRPQLLGVVLSGLMRTRRKPDQQMQEVQGETDMRKL